MLHFPAGDRTLAPRAIPTGLPALGVSQVRSKRAGGLGAALDALRGFGRLLFSQPLTHGQYRVMLFIGAQEGRGAEIEDIAAGLDLGLGHAAMLSRSLVKAGLICARAPGDRLQLSAKGCERLERLALRHLAGLRTAQAHLARIDPRV